MPNHELAFADIMAELLAQTPNRPSDPPVVRETKPAIESHEDLVLQAVFGLPAEATPEVVEVPAAEQVENKPEERKPLVSSGYAAAVARFRQMRGA
jgi:hypothetical protein